MQQFHLKVSVGYYTKNENTGTLPLFIHQFLINSCSLSAAYEIQTRGYSLYVCNASAGQWNEREKYALSA